MKRIPGAVMASGIIGARLQSPCEAAVRGGELTYLILTRIKEKFRMESVWKSVFILYLCGLIRIL